jgi:hypothetical protein
MKKLLIILLFPLFSFSQEDTCFTKQEILDISYTLDSLYELDDINKKIIAEQTLLIQDLKHYIKLDSLQIDYQKHQTELLQKNIDLYVQREKYIKPKWYDNKALWFTGGILTTMITTKVVIELVK